jgi:hypothetical protein
VRHRLNNNIDVNGREIALEVIKGKSKNFNKLMNDKLQEIKTDLAINGKQTKEKRLVMKEFSTEITYDEENLLSMSKENLRVVRPALTHNLSESLSLFFYLHSYLSPFFYLLTLVNKTPVIFITSFAYRATLFALSVVPLKLIAKS